jgi:hypothetical protein
VAEEGAEIDGLFQPVGLVRQMLVGVNDGDGGDLASQGGKGVGRGHRVAPWAFFGFSFEFRPAGVRLKIAWRRSSPSPASIQVSSFAILGVVRSLETPGVKRCSVDRRMAN